MVQEPLVSVVTPVYRDHQYLDRAERSLRAQTYDRIEWVVVDSSGADHVERRADVYVYQPPQGVSAARNRGIEAASGEYVAFLDADDWFAPEKIERCVDAGGRFVYSDAVDIDVEEDAESYRESYVFDDRDAPHVDFFRFDGVHGNIATSSIVVDRALLDARRFDPELAGGEDYHLWTRLLREATPTHVPEPLVYIRQRGDSLSSDPEMMYENRMAAIDKLAATFDEIAAYADERRQLERYSYGRSLLRDHRMSEARSVFAESVRDGYYRAAVMYLLTFLPSNADRAVDVLDRLQSRLA